MSNVIDIRRVRGSDRYSIDFYLKSHLRDFVCALSGGDTFHINMFNVVGCIALSTLTKKPAHAHRVNDTFFVGRERVVGTISVDHARREGLHSCSLPVFEALVEHLFKHMMLVHVDLRRDQGMTQMDAIREFLAIYDVDLDAITIETLKKTMQRRRKRAQANTSAAGKFRATVSPAPEVRKAS